MKNFPSLLSNDPCFLSNELCSVALKEWAATVCALRESRQIVILRKGGLLDAATEHSEMGTFHIEYSNFWLWPTQWHQNPLGIKPEARLWFDEIRQKRSENAAILSFDLWARVEKSWNFSPDDEARLLRAPHIWSRAYLETRFNYKPEAPLICAALRVYQIPVAHQIENKAEFGGCRSWVEIGKKLSLQNAQPVLSDEAFAQQLASFEYSIR